MIKVLILNPYLPTLGGGEKDMGYLCAFIEKYYKGDVSIDILVHNYNAIDVFSDDYITIDDVNKQYGLDLRQTQIRKYDFIMPKNVMDSIRNRIRIENITKEYDLFINFMFNSKHMGKAPKNIYRCMFPSKPFEIELGGNWIIKRIAAILDRKFNKSYDWIVSNSQYTKQWLETYWGKRENSSVVYPPVFYQDKAQNRYHERDKKNIIVSCGRFFVAAHSKKQLEMVEFFVHHGEIFQDYEYHLAGALINHPDDIEYFHKIQKIADSVDNVFLHPNCDYDELIELYKSAKIFWHATGYGVDQKKEPEKMEHFGITTVEAMSYGAVPIVIRRGGQEETVCEGENGFLWETEEECVQKTYQVIKDDMLRKKMAEKSVEFSRTYSIENFYKKYEAIFKELHI